MKNYKLVPYCDSDHDGYIQSQLEAFTKYIIEFFGKCDMSIMEGHLNILKPYGIYELFLIKNNFNFLEYIARYNANNSHLLLQNHAFDKTFWQDWS